MASEMKPCPFCGSNQLSFRSTPDMDTDGKFHRISCNECGASSRATFAMDACPLFYEELSKAWNTRPAPSATDTGLVTKGYLFKTLAEKSGWFTKFSFTDPAQGGLPYRAVEKLCLQSQAEELLAAERAKTERWHKKAMDAGVIVHSDGTTSHPMRKERDDLKAKLAAAEKALEQLRSDCQEPIDMYERNGPEFTSPHGNEYESTSYVMAKFAELVASIDAARAVLGGKPS